MALRATKVQRSSTDDPERLAHELRELYTQQLAEPSFAALLDDMRQRGAPVVAGRGPVQHLVARKPSSLP